MAYKLAILWDNQWVEHSHAALFERRAMEGGGERLHVGVPSGDPDVLRNLLQCLEPPYFLLYVLHTPRGEAAPGRYQSPELSNDQVLSFLTRYADFLRSDARFDIWVHSPATRGTIVWERHNLIYAYGPLDCFEAQLRRLEFAVGPAAIPGPHQHHYREECDADASAVIAEWDWVHSPLKPADEQ
jgi:hypothetical protein